MPAVLRSPTLRLVVALAVLHPLSAFAIDCGEVLTQDTDLDSDLVCGPGEIGLVIGASGIEVDLKGHTITGPDTGVLATGGVGVLIASPFTDVVIRNGTIQGFGIGVRVDTTSDNTVRNLHLLDNVRGVDVANAHDNVIEKNHIELSANDAVRLGGVSSGNLVRQNTLVANVFGISVADDTRANTVRQNTVTNGGAFGIAVFTSGSANLVSRNVVTGTGADAIVVSATAVGTVVSQNNVSDNGRDGVLVAATTTGTLVEQNEATHNGDDGIDVRSAATTVTQNTASYNADLGIEAVAGVTDGGGNTAYGNGNPLQCTGVDCSG